MAEGLRNDTTTLILQPNNGEKFRKITKILDPLLLFHKEEIQEIFSKNNTKDEKNYSQNVKKKRNLELGKLLFYNS